MNFGFAVLQKKAKGLGLNLWTRGGYYYLSGFRRGSHRQAMFSDLRGVARTIDAELSK